MLLNSLILIGVSSIVGYICFTIGYMEGKHTAYLDGFHDGLDAGNTDDEE